MTTAPRRQPICGTDLWRQTDGQRWSYWDLWFSLVCAGDYSGDWEALGAALERRGNPWARDTEAKRSHLDDLVARLERSGLSPHQLAADVIEDKRVRLKAQTKVMTQELMARDLTEAMVDTPRRRLRERALRGYWDRFPRSPGPFYEEFADELEARPFYDERATMHLVGRLREALEDAKRGDRLDTTKRLALYRAFLTAGYEAHVRADDSSGDLGRALKTAWEVYASIPWRQSGIDPDVYYSDLCGMVVWNEFSSLYQTEEVPFRLVPAGDIEHVEGILRELERELRSARLRYQADEAAQAVAWLHIAKRNLGAFVRVSGDLGSDHWIPIDRMARVALNEGRPDIAEAVFTAADQPGLKRDYLRERRWELLGDRPRSARHRLSVTD